MKIIAVMPAYNESQRIANVVRVVKKYVKRVIVVDDGSSDDTGEVARKAGAYTIVHVINRGAGASTSTGIEAALQQGAEIVVLLDADGQHNPEDIPRMVEPIKNGMVDVSIGVRTGRGQMPLIKRIGNKALSSLTKAAYGIECGDTQCGFRAFNRKAADILKEIDSDGYGFASEMIGKIKKNDLKMLEVPIETLYLDKKKGTTVMDGLKIFGSIFSGR